MSQHVQLRVKLIASIAYRATIAPFSGVPYRLITFGDGGEREGGRKNCAPSNFFDMMPSTRAKERRVCYIRRRFLLSRWGGASGL